jgi:FkbM family methyltransferase
MSRAPTPPAVPFTIIVPTVYGQMMVNRHDINQTNKLFKTGLAVEHNDIVMLSQLLQGLGVDHVVLDVGANFGVYSIAMSRVVGPNGQVHAFEPQRLIYNLLVGSVALNSLTNVYCHNVAVGEREGRVEIPQFDYNQPLNFGSIEFTGEQREQLTQARGHDPARAEFVPLTTIDRFQFPKVSLMKVDVEGMELQVLRGSMKTIRRCRPLLYVEHLKTDREALRQCIMELGYVVHQNDLNFLGIPTELTSVIQVTSGPPAALHGGSVT